MIFKIMITSSLQSYSPLTVIILSKKKGGREFASFSSCTSGLTYVYSKCALSHLIIHPSFIDVDCADFPSFEYLILQ